jgi:hypothetical protein
MTKSAALASVMMAVVLGAAAAMPANANCRDDIQELSARLSASPPKSANVMAAKKELAKAERAADFDEIGCDNAMVRAWRAYKTPPAPKKDVNDTAAR